MKAAAKSLATKKFIPNWAPFVYHVKLCGNLETNIRLDPSWDTGCNAKFDLNYH